MNPEVKAKWIEALRSGRYKQGKNMLRSGDKLCCLGVLCEIAVQDGVIAPPSLYDPTEGRYAYGPYAATEALPESVWRWAGLQEGVPSWPYDRHREDYGRVGMPSDDNDNGMSFTDIADKIERYY